MEIVVDVDSNLLDEMEPIGVNLPNEILHLDNKVLIMELELEDVAVHKNVVLDSKRIVLNYVDAMAMYFNSYVSVAIKVVNHFRLGNFCGGLIVHYYSNYYLWV